MNEDDLYQGLVKLCQQYGHTTGRTYELLHSAIDSIDTDDGK